MKIIELPKYLTIKLEGIIEKQEYQNKYFLHLETMVSLVLKALICR